MLIKKELGFLKMGIHAHTDFARLRTTFISLLGSRITEENISDATENLILMLSYVIIGFLLLKGDINVIIFNLVKSM